MLISIILGWSSCWWMTPLCNFLHCFFSCCSSLGWERVHDGTICDHWITSGNSTTVHVHVSFCCCIHKLVVTGICCSICYRDYFGEKIGIYLAWLGKCLHIVCTVYTTYWLLETKWFVFQKEKKVRHAMSIVSYCRILKVPNIWPCSPGVSDSSVVRASNRYPGRSWVWLLLGAQKILFSTIST